MIRFNSIEERRAWYREYYRKNHTRLRKMYNDRYSKKAKEKRDKINSQLHPLMISNGRKPRKGTIKNCPNCNNDFYARPYQSDKLCCNEKCKNEYYSKLANKVRCIVCGKGFNCNKFQVSKKNRKCCSRDCSSILIQETAFIKRLINPGSVKSVDRCLRYSKQMEDWRISVFKRDDYTCKKCGARSKKGKPVYLQAHHIKQFATHPELRFDVSNGETLCKPCHKKTPHIMWVTTKYKKAI